jgi:hypothetical protein
MKRMLLVGYGALLLAALSSYALLGWHVRMLADDYCTAASALNRTVLESIIYDYYNWNWTYVDSFLKAVLARFQPAYHQVQTLLLLTALFAALWWLVRELAAVLDLPAMRKHSLLVAALFLLLIVYTAPNKTVFFWYSAMIPYSFPVALVIAASAALVRWVRQGYRHTGRYAAFFALATVVLNGLANTFFLPLLGALALATIYTLWRVSKESRRASLLMITAVTAANVASFLVVFSAPGNAVRQAHELEVYGFATPSIPQLIALTFQNTVGYLIVPYGYTLVYGLLAFTIGIILTLALGHEDNEQIACFSFAKRWAWVDGLVLFVLSASIVVSTIAATSYGTGLLLGRTMFLARTAQTLTMMFLGYLLAVWLARRGFPYPWLKRRPAYRAVRLALTGLLIAVPIGLLVDNLSRLPSFREYAEDWDAVHAHILAEVAAGNRGIIEVPPYRYSVAALLNLDELDEAAGYTRGCASSFYGIESIVMPQIQNPLRIGFWSRDAQ